MAIHSQNDQVILEFGLKKPAFRICVNTPTTHGSIGLTTGLDPAMTLGCGGYGGNITSDNISPRHLLNIKRLAYEITPALSRVEGPAAGRADSPAAGRTERSVPAAAGLALPSAPQRPVPVGISADVLTRRIEEFLGSRGYRAAPAAPINSPQAPLEFVCEEDVRVAIRAGRKLLVSERAIVTPAARELGDEHRVFSVAPWRG
jgi:acetaldehyde dehydrogenase (acetylating)